MNGIALSLADYIAIQERKNFLIVRAEIDESPEDSGRLTVKVEDEAPVGYNKETRFWLERNAINHGYWRWPAGGCAILAEFADNIKALLTVYRDAGAPTNANTETIGSGLGANETEIAYPLRTALREGIEEIIITDKHSIFYPLLHDDLFGFNLEIRSIALGGKLIFNEFHNHHAVGIPAHQLEFPGKTKVSVEWRGETYTTYALINKKPNIRGLDVLTAIEVKLPCTLKEITLRDGEIAGGNPLDRPIRAYEVANGRVTGKVLAAWEHGKRSDPPVNLWPAKLNPNLKTIIDAMHHEDPII